MRPGGQKPDRVSEGENSSDKMCDPKMFLVSRKGRRNGN